MSRTNPETLSHNSTLVVGNMSLFMSRSFVAIFEKIFKNMLNFWNQSTVMYEDTQYYIAKSTTYLIR